MKAFVVFLAVIATSIATSWPDETCPPEQETDWTIEKLLRHDDCNKFYKCTFGQPVEQQCPSGLWFCLETWRCEWPHLVDCKDRNIPVETTTTLKPTTNATTTPEPTTTTTTNTTTTTTTPKTTTTTPEPTTTTTTTPKPTTTTPEPTTTPKPNTTTTTTTPKPNTTTTTTTTTTPKPTTTSTITTTGVPGFRPNGCPINVFEHWLLPHEINCNLFYYCVWGERVLRQCPNGLHFNRVIQVCDWPRDAGCWQNINS